MTKRVAGIDVGKQEVAVSVGARAGSPVSEHGRGPHGRAGVGAGPSRDACGL